jgi:predicted ArsR family transcriptional regulator
MKALTIEPNMGRPDDFYEALVEAHRDLTDEQSQALNAALILLLANHVGELEVLRDALRRARKTVTDNPPR